MRFRIQQAIVLSFVVLILTGTLLLLLPGVTRGPRLTVLEALFTATSAVCVTGLSVIDPGTRLSGQGQGVLLLLIQLGGLGILSLSGFVLVLLRQRHELRHRLYMEEVHPGVRDVTPLMVLRGVVTVTILVEGVGFLLLFAGIGMESSSFGLRTAWQALFHSVSAFCNAGFSLYPTSLESFRDNPLVNLTVMALIVTGGLGFTVVAELGRYVRLPRRQRRWWRLSLHTRVVLVSTAVLILAGAALFAVMEWNNELVGTRWAGRLLAPFFFSVTCRTAGFDTVPTGALTSVTLQVGLILMFIGACPGGTGGGVKATTAAILVAAGASRVLGRSDDEIFARRIPGPSLAKAVATVAAFACILLLANVGLQLTEVGLVSHAGHPDRGLDLFFESTSAIGTVGLSTGVTSEISGPGRLILVALMFLGRTGPLVVGASLIGTRRPLAAHYPEEEILVG